MRVAYTFCPCSKDVANIANILVIVRAIAVRIIRDRFFDDLKSLAAYGQLLIPLKNKHYGEIWANHRYWFIYPD
ncbi:MAG: hypothetical protein HC796_07860 [Synechococcaceae cyanobacterium RL_1_2]|nr:hypothetical protein [Synechococcaceae cyanobacterium RL_1_2]